MPAVARETDKTKCPAHAQGEIIEGEGSVLACYKPVARKDDKVKCKDGSIDTIIEGDSSVLIGGKPVACKGHKTEHGGVIVTGCPRVMIGQGGGGRGGCGRGAANRGSAFIKYSAKKKTPFIKPDPT